MFGAEIVTVADRKDRERVLQETYDAASARGQRPYLVPYGGSSPTGVLGYAFAIEELIEQQIKSEWIVFGTSSGGTHAGLVLGQRKFGFKGKILGISIDESEDWLRKTVSRLASEASARLGGRIEFQEEDVLANADYCKAGYGIVTPAEREAVGLFAQTEGLLLDPVYTGRAAAGMIDLIRRGYFKKSETVLFWHTGGQPALFADRYADLMGEAGETRA
jgi:D-cysteine desulfhydrase